MHKITLPILLGCCTTLLNAELVTEYFKNGVVKTQIEYKDHTRTETDEGIKYGLVRQRRKPP